MREEEEEIDRKPRMNRFRLGFFILLLVVVAGTTACLFAPAFRIVTVSAQAGVNVSGEEIIEKANIQLGENIFRINDTKIMKNIEQIAYVKKAHIYRALPNRIILKVEEREPYAIVKYLESYAIADKYGYVLEIKEENTMPTLPIIYGINTEDCVAGEKLSGISGLKYENAIYLLETADKMKFQYHFHEINYDDATNVKLYIQERDIDVVYGAIVVENIEEKLGHLASILTQLGNKKGKIDMSNSDYLARTVFTERQ